MSDERPTQSNSDEGDDQAAAPSLEDLQEENALFRALFRHMPIGWAYHRIILDDSGRPIDYEFLKVNKTFETFTGLQAAQILGKRVTEVIPGIQDAKPDLISLYGEVAINGGEQTFELYFEPFDRWYSVNVGSPGEGYFICVFNEITAKKRAEMELARTADTLARTNEELKQFTYVASHDLQEPLRMVASYTELLGKRYKGQLGEEADEFIHFAVDGARRMQQLINDLLFLSRMGRTNKLPAPVELTEICEEVLQALQLSIRDTGATITLGDLPAVLGDRSQMIQVFQNLVGNAIKFRGEDPPQVAVSAQPEGDRWIISVKDNGIGIDADYLARIFGVFQRIHPRADYPGNGIGLAIVKKIVEQSGGTVKVESTLGQGTTFSFDLPAPGRGIQ